LYLDAVLSGASECSAISRVYMICRSEHSCVGSLYEKEDYCTVPERHLTLKFNKVSSATGGHSVRKIGNAVLDQRTAFDFNEAYFAA
jgi:hypothetical protein